jgi:hypothetical protein
MVGPVLSKICAMHSLQVELRLLWKTSNSVVIALITEISRELKRKFYSLSEARRSSCTTQVDYGEQ